MLNLRPSVFAGCQNLQPIQPYPGDSCIISSDDLKTIVNNRGGGIELWGQTHTKGDPANQTHGLRLYLVIAAETSDSACEWTDPAVQFSTFLGGTLSRTHAAVNTSAIQLLPQAVLQIVHSFFKFKPDWSELERRVERENLHMQVSTVSHAGQSEMVLLPMQHMVFSKEGKYVMMQVTPASLVREYRNFLALKIAHKDWHSKLLSPSVFEAPNGKKLVDAVR